MMLLPSVSFVAEASWVTAGKQLNRVPGMQNIRILYVVMLDLLLIRPFKTPCLLVAVQCTQAPCFGSDQPPGGKRHTESPICCRIKCIHDILSFSAILLPSEPPLRPANRLEPAPALVEGPF